MSNSAEGVRVWVIALKALLCVPHPADPVSTPTHNHP